MGLLANGFRDKLGAFQTYGATASNNAYPSALRANYARTAALRNICAGQGITDDKVGYPQGGNHPASWMIPQKAGALSSHNRTRGVATATLSLAEGRNLTGTSGGVATADASLQLVVSLTGTSDGVAIVTGNVQAALGMAGSAAGSSTASGEKNALAWAYGTSDGSCTATLTRYATGRLYGSITPFTELSPENLAQTVLDYAQITPIHANVQKINDADVMGAGISGDKWRG